MSRQGVEGKPRWSEVPEAVRREVETLAAARVIRGARIWGGYGPAPTFRLRLADGRGLFFKAVHSGSNEFSRQALAREERVYQELGALLAPVAPQFYGVIAVDDWRALLLEDLGPKSAPPWKLALARIAARDLAAFHASTLGVATPAWLDNVAESAARITWQQADEESDGLRQVAALAGAHAADAQSWLRASLPRLSAVTSALRQVPGPYAIIHGDVRSDNLRIVNGRLRLFDWPSVAVDFPEFDLAEFAQSVEVDGGPDAERVVAWYRERLDVRPEALDAAIGRLAAFFAYHAWQPEIPDLPRLRRFQRQQLAVTLRWLARRLAMPLPRWTAALD
ncbi:MAG TPA: phosphotransferase [Ktedonobacterales bacterium]